MYIDLVTINLCPGQGGGGVKPSGTLEISENGVYNVYSYSSASVDVHPSASLSETYISNGDYNITGEFNGGVITVDVPAPQFVTETLNVSANGTYTPGQGVDGYSQVVVDVPQNVIGFTEEEITEGIKIVNLSNSASYVNSYAFANNGYIQTVNLPNCTEVRSSAFQNCTSLSSIYLQNCKSIGTNAFYGCKPLKSIELPECLEISSYAFAYCYSLTFVSLSKCSSIGNKAFSFCSNLYSIYLLNDNVVNIQNRDVFFNTPIYTESSSGKIYVPYNLVDSYKASPKWDFFIRKIFPYYDEFEFINGLVVGSASSMDSTYLDVLNISAAEVISVSMYNVESLESSTFMNYPNLVSISFPKLTYYGDDTFAGCTSLSEVIISLPSLGARVFAGCTSLETVNVKFNGLVTIGSDVFSGCTALTSIYVNEDYYSDYLSAQNWSDYSSFIVSIIPELTFKNGIIYGSASSIGNNFLDILGITKEQVTYVSLPNCLKVENNTFYNCNNLLTVDIPECSYIGTGGFSECANLKSINLTKCEYIGSNAFRGAFQTNGSNINLVLPVCSYIGGSAFYWTKVLSTITFESNSICSISDDPFNNAGLNSIYVPASLVDAYKSATNWYKYSNIIFPIE